MKCHLKKKTVPTTWDIHRKDATFTTRPLPGGHSREFSMPLNTILKDILGLCQTKKEVKFLLQSKDIMVDGRLRYDEKHPIGLFDVISFPRVDQHYIMTLDERKKLRPLLITKTEAKSKVARVSGKTFIRGGKVQLNTSDGRAFLVDAGQYAVGDTIMFSIPDQKISKHLRLEKGKMALLLKGRHRGVFGILEEVDKQHATIKDAQGELLKTRTGYVFVVGEGEKPVIKVRV